MALLNMGDKAMEYRIVQLEEDIKRHDDQISSIAASLNEIKNLISQIRWFISGGIVFIMIDKLGFFQALGVVS
jgi:hypothetical protein|tara:strand:+ start:107 stop:325 length:219 start_codon:yes stop_codon:yes gene_type:complete